MDRFMLFGGMAYYPCGGWQDYIGSYPSLGKALEKGNGWEIQLSPRGAWESEEGKS